MMPFIFKLAANLLLQFVCSHVYSQHEVVINDCNSTAIKISAIKTHFNSYMGLDLCTELYLIYLEMALLYVRQ